jgi:uncharacterized protein
VRYLTLDDARAAALGGLIYGAGGGGYEDGLRLADIVFGLGRPRLAELSDFDDDDIAVVSSGVGAPGAEDREELADKLRAFDLLRTALRSAPGRRGEVVGTIVGHPGAHTPGSWAHSAIDPTVAVLDCATNGRGHPSVKMGGLGLASRPEVTVTHAAVGLRDDDHARLEMVVSGPLADTSDIVRRASEAAGGSIAACRGPFPIGFLKGAGAVGAISATISLGQALLDVAGGSAQDTIDAILGTLGGTVVMDGRVTGNTVGPRGAYDIGTVTVSGNGKEAVLTVANEFVALDVGGERSGSFPDLIMALSVTDGMPPAALDLKDGDDVVIAVVDSSRIPLGAGVWDPAAYTGVEGLTGTELGTYALAKKPDQ